MAARPRTFGAEVQAGHKGCAVEVPFHPTVVWGPLPTEIAYASARGVRVAGTVKGVPFESFIVLRWKKHWLLLAEAALAAAGVAAGDTIRVTVAPAVQPPRRAVHSRQGQSSRSVRKL